MTTPTDAELIWDLRNTANRCEASGWASHIPLRAAADRLAALVEEVERLNGSLTMGVLKLAWDANEQLEAENKRLREALSLTFTDCEHLHHRPSEYHKANQPCPVESRIREALKETP